MWPLGVAGVIVALFVVGSAASGGSAQQGAMIFKDYQWLILMPSTIGNHLAAATGLDGSVLFPGSLDPRVVAALPPPPGQAAGSGKWVEYPGGYQAAQGVDPRVPAPGAQGNPLVPVFPDVPHGASVYAWRPADNVLTVINGYSVIESHWVWDASAWQAIHDTGGILLHQPPWHIGWGTHAHWTPPPPPPGESAHSGTWHGVAPGYYVWLTPTNTNASAVAQAAQNPAQASWLSQGATGGGTTNTAPTLTAQPVPAVPPAY